MMLFRYSAFAALLATSALAHGDEDHSAEYPALGVNSFEALSYSEDIHVDENCDYHFTVNFAHNEAFPVGSEDTCVPGVSADYDGLPMLAGRWFWHEYPAYVQEATGMNHLSLDYNPCGHPTGGFLMPHYDMHFYMVTPSFRSESMVCDVIPGTPACDPVQSTADGKAFFELETSTSSVTTSDNTTDDSPVLVNMPSGFAYNVADAVMHMGMHSFDRSTAPVDPAEWMEPTLVFVTYNSTVICFEPMLPFHFTLGDEDHSYESGKIEYVEQSISTLPYEYTASFDAATKVTTVHFTGKSNVCQADFDVAKAEYEAANPETAEGVADGGASLFSSVVMMGGAVLVLVATMMA